MASNGRQIAYSTKMHSIVNLFRAITHIVDSKPALLNKQGVFRIPGELTVASKLLNTCVNKPAQQCVEILMQDKRCIHDLLALLPLALQDMYLINIMEPKHQSETENLRHCLNNPALHYSSKQDLIMALITYCLSSKSIEMQQAGEILYHYAHIMAMSLQYRETTQMGPDNLAIIFSPIILNALNLLTLDENRSEILTKVSNMQQILLSFFEQNHANKTFHQAFQQLTIHLYETRLSQLTALNRQEEKAISFSPTESVANEIIQLNKTITSLQQQRATLKSNKEIGRNTKKGAKKALKAATKLQQNKLTSWREELDRAISTQERLSQCLQDIRSDKKRLSDSASSIRHFHHVFFPTDTPETAQTNQSHHEIIMTL